MLTTNCHKTEKRRLCYSSDARQTDPEAAAEDFQLVAISNGDRPEGAGAPWRDLRRHRPQHPRQTGQTQCEEKSCAAVINTSASFISAVVFVFFSVCFSTEASKEETQEFCRDVHRLRDG